jgi:hypothetical protein
VRLPLPARLAALNSTVAIVALFGLGVWSFTDMHQTGAQRPPIGPPSQMPRPGG